MRNLALLRRRTLRPLRNEDGAALVFFGLMVVALLAAFVLAVDVGSAYNARSEAQRTADAAALAGAGLYQSLPPALSDMQIRPLVPDTAARFAAFNYVGWEDADSISIIMPNTLTNRRVGVEVFGRAPLFFAPFIGVVTVPVYAYAEARVDNASSTDCLKPFAIPDMWNNPAATGAPIYDPANAAQWTWNPNTSVYVPWDGNTSSTHTTGWGSGSRNTSQHQNDIGRRLVVKRGNQDVANSAVDAPVHKVPSDFFGVVLNNDTRSIDGVTSNHCANPANANNGADIFRSNICRCNNSVVSIGDQLSTEPGAMIGPTQQGIGALMSGGPPVQWVSTTGGGYVATMTGTQVQSHPRIFKALVYNPVEATQGRSTLTVTNIGVFFLEGLDNHGNVLARFMMYASGQGGGGGTGTGNLIRTLQLVDRTMTRHDTDVTVVTIAPE